MEFSLYVKKRIFRVFRQKKKREERSSSVPNVDKGFCLGENLDGNFLIAFFTQCKKITQILIKFQQVGIPKYR